jgi:hypothetical protein
MWLDFMARTLPKMTIRDPAHAYHLFMKYGLSEHYWLEYIFLGFVDYTDHLIVMTGFPDRPETLPHRS